MLLFSLLSYHQLIGQSKSGSQWNLLDRTTINRIVDREKNAAYEDNIEMAGKRVAAIVTYTIDTSGNLELERQVFFPQLHPYIKSDDPDWLIYRAYLKKTFKDDVMPKLFVENKRVVAGKLKETIINGTLKFLHESDKLGVRLSRTLFPSSSERLFVEQITATNTTDSTLKFRSSNVSLKYKDLGAEGIFTLFVDSDAPEQFDLPAKESITFSVKYSAYKEDEILPMQTADDALNERQTFLKEMSSSLILETPNPTLNTLFEFSKIRASESIFESKLGLIHSPGGGRYYVGIWANDQAEYVSPFFPYLGYGAGNESAINTYRAFAKETNKAFKKIRYAFEIEGTVPPFLLDRGDAAMIAYGASQFVLTLGDQEVANEFWPLITWCLEYCKRQLNKQGVVQSESDEMEGRIETGTANLSTSSLYYGALELAADLGKSLGKPNRVAKGYQQDADKLKLAIENYFGANIEGLDTYRYYDGHENLRHWICLPLVVGINDRKDATIEALFNRLWTDNGVHVEKNSANPAISNIFWDRGTLYALRGTFLSGATEVSLKKLEEFSKARLLGNRVPYVVEAFPEGNMAHLSAESGLYCRVFIEGMFGIVPTGLNSFTCIPRLPKDWDEMALRKIRAFGRTFDLEVSRVDNTTIQVKIIDDDGQVLLDKSTKPDETVAFKF